MQQESTRRTTKNKEPIALVLLLRATPQDSCGTRNPFVDPNFQEALEHILCTPSCASYDNLRGILCLLHTARRHEAKHYGETSNMYKWLIDTILRMDEIIIPAKDAYYKQLHYAR